ncbi:MAG: alkaline phosphatase [Lentimicrobiaceae bacterium]|nr:alkaline phosphatase [Lentimicrobiaceae bacterium]
MEKAKYLFVLVLTFFQVVASAQNERLDTVKNVIILIPDGANSGLLALSRWYNGNKPLAVDPLICGGVKTHNADGKLPDSAPAATAYAAGMKTKSSYIGVDSNLNPRISVLELAKLKGLSTGVVVTCEFPHATPAGFVCHYNSRESKNYKNLIKQFIYNSPTLVFAGGKKYLDSSNFQSLLKPNGIDLVTDKSSFEQLNDLPQSKKSLWALFSDWQDSTNCKSYECDRDTAKEPSLSEMTNKAIQLLSQNEKGFFLLVEGSQIDWAAHNNDPYAAVTDFLEFDKAVALALDFAKKDKNTVVIVCPDHGSGGISLGSSEETVFSAVSKTKIDDIDIKKDIVEPLKQIKWSARKLAEMMLTDCTYTSKDSIAKYYNFHAADSFVNMLEILAEDAENADSIQYLLGRNFSIQNHIGWTTTKHTGEDVFLAIYAPEGIKKKTGIIDNSDIGKYMAEILNLADFDIISNQYFYKHTDLFDDAVVDSESLTVEKNGKRITVYPNTSILQYNGTVMLSMNSIAIYINGYYYLPLSVLRFF